MKTFFSMQRLFVAALFGGAMLVGTSAHAQQIQIPSLQVCNDTKLSANTFVIIDTRAGGG